MITRAAVLLLIALLGSTVASPVAGAASFTSAPYDAYYKSGAGPFSWYWQTGDPGGSNGATAYVLSTESRWHRCFTGGHVSVTNLPEGVFRITVADDINLNWYSARGLLFSGATQPCFDNFTTPPPTAPTYDEIMIDGTAPALTAPKVIVEKKQALITAEGSSEQLSGIDHYSWKFGDGVGVDTTAPAALHNYLAYGTYQGSVVAVDKAGNQSSAPFTVTLSAPAPASKPTSTTPTVNTSFDTRAPAVEAYGNGRNRVGSLVWDFSCDEPCRLAITASVRVGSKRYALIGRSGRAGTTASTFTLKVSARTRKALKSALRKRKNLAGIVSVTATDAAGNRSSTDFRFTFVR